MTTEMARGRFISKSLGASERFYRLHHEHPHAQQLGEFAGELYMLLITHSDDFGRFHGDGFTVKMQAFPVSPRRVDEFDAALTMLDDVHLIERYSYNGGTKLAVQIIDFEPHQQGLQRRTSSKFPSPSGKSDPPITPTSNSSTTSEVQRSSENFTEIQEMPDESLNFSPEVEVEAEVEVEGDLTAAATHENAESGRGQSRKRSRKASADDRRARAQQLVELYRASCPKLKPIVALTARRIISINARLVDVPSLEQWRTFFERLNASTFCTGGGRDGWVADFDFALKPESWTKTFEGKYDDRRGSLGRPVRTADDARAAVRERGIENVTADADIDLR